MRVKELMTDDWYYWEAEGKKYPLQVTKDTFKLMDEDISNFQPIPITEEILEKNGFVRTNADVTTYKLTKYLYWTPRGLEHELSEIPICPLNYVHELQHTLKLCNIDRKIIV